MSDRPTLLMKDLEGLTTEEVNLHLTQLFKETEEWEAARDRCVIKDCENAAHYIHPRSFCPSCWTEWWNCNDCFEVGKECEKHNE